MRENKINTIKVLFVLMFTVVSIVSVSNVYAFDFGGSSGGGQGCGSCGVSSSGGGSSWSGGGGGGGGGGGTPIINKCTPKGTQTQNVSCPAGQTGIIVQQRSHSCPSNSWSGWVTISNTCTQNACTNGATNFPYCNNNYCTNGATNFPACNNNNNNYCTNGYTNYPTCGPTTCTNGATNFPYCNNNYCTNGATNFPYCNNNVTYVWCNGVQYVAPYNCPVVTPTAQINVNPSTIYSGSSATLYWSSTNASSCNISGNGVNYYTTSGSQTIYPAQSGTYTITCTGVNGGQASDSTYITVYQNQTCSYGQVWLNGYCQNINNYCSNGATNYPYCNNNVTYVWCNGVQYSAGYVCPVQNNNLSVTTTGSSPYSTTATIYGNVSTYGDNSSIWFDYGTSAYNLQYQTPKQNTSNSGQFSSNLSNLQCNTTYYYRAAAQNSYTTKYGQTLSFRTPSCYVAPQPASDTVLTRSATSIGYYTAQLNGVWVSGTNGGEMCQVFFDYGTNYNLTKRTASQQISDYNTTNYFAKGISGLSPNTTYYFRAARTCYDGTKYGSILSFRTPAISYVNKKPVYKYYPKPVTIVTTKSTECNCEDKTYLSLSLESLEGTSKIGGISNFKVDFKNVSSSTLQDVVVKVELPEELTINNSDRGQFTSGARTLTYTIPVLSIGEQGAFVISTKVASGLELGRQIVVNAKSNYTVPSIIKNGQTLKGEVTTYIINIASNDGTINGGNNGNSNSATSWIPTNFVEWIIFFLVFVIFLSAVRYVFTAFKKA